MVIDSVLTSSTLIKRGIGKLSSPDLTDYETQLSVFKQYEEQVIQGYGAIDAKNKALEASTKDLTGTMKLFANQCYDSIGTGGKLLQKGQEFNQKNYMTFLNEGNYTKGLKNASKVIEVYNGIADSYMKSAEARTLLTQKENASAVEAAEIDKTIAKNIAQHQENFADQITKVNKGLGTALQDGTTSLGGYVKKLGLAKLETIALTAKTMIMNAAISFGVSFAIQAAVTAFDNYIHKSEKIIEAGKEATETIQNLTKSYQELTTATNSASSRYAILAQGVNADGSNNYLNTDEYQEYLDLSNQLADLYPSLIKNWDSEGNAILTLSGSIDTITKSLKELLKTERQSVHAQFLDEMPTAFSGVNEQVYKLQEEQKKKQEMLDKAQELKDKAEMSNGVATVKNSQNWVGEIVRDLIPGGSRPQDILDSIGLTEYKTVAKSTDDGIYLEYDSEDLKSAIEDRQITIDALDEKNKKAIKELYAGLLPYISAWMETSDEFQSLSESSQQIAQQFIQSLDLSKVNWTSSADMSKDINNNIFKPLQKATPEAQQLLSNLFNPSGAMQAMSAVQMRSSMEEMIAELAKILPEETIGYLKVALKWDDKASDPNEIIKALEDKYNAKVSGYPLDELQRYNTAYDRVLTYNKQQLDAFYEFQAKEGSTFADAVEQFEEVAGDKLMIGQLDLKAYTEDIDNVQSAIQTLSGALKSLKDGSLDSDAILDLLQSYPELAGYIDDTDALQKKLESLIAQQPVELIEKLQKVRANLNAVDQASLDNIIAQLKSLSDTTEKAEVSTEKLSDAVSKFEASSNLLKSAKEDMTNYGRISLDTLQTILEKYPEMEEAVVEYLGGLRSSENIFDELSKCYQVDSKNFAKYLNGKLANNADAYNQFTSANAKLIDSFNSVYNTDLANCKTWAEAKAQIFEKVAEYQRTYTNQFGTTVQETTDLNPYFNKETGELVGNLKASNVHDGTLIAEAYKLKEAYDKLQESYLKSNGLDFDSLTSNFQSIAAIGSDSAKETKDAWAEAADAEIATIKHMYAMEQITATEYYNALERINNKYYAGQAKYISDYRSLLEEVYSGRKSAHIEAFEDQKSRLSHLLEMNVIDQEAYYFELEKLIKEYYQGNALYAEEYYSEEEALYTALFDMKKQALQEEIDALQDVADANEKAYDIEKKRWDVFNARSQETVNVYDTSKGGWTWQRDETAFSESMNELYTSLMQEQIDALQKLTDAIDDNTRNFNYVDPITGQKIETEHLSLLTDEQYQKLYDSTFGGNSMKDVIDRLIDVPTTHNTAVTQNSNSNAQYSINIENVNSNNADDFIKSLNAALSSASGWSALLKY